MRKFLGLLIVAVFSVSATTTVAQALTSSTEGGYAYDSSTQSMYSCDTLDDGAAFENQSWNADNQRSSITSGHDAFVIRDAVIEAHPAVREFP
ncbi:hypothetical protein [Promicromonospora sp. NPDC023805]|uniref:hypothetical protein n=1 Tax=Promicromonospora sp. NPDC023805 TaxID=3154696 RepID=UPI0033FB36E8